VLPLQQSAKAFLPKREDGFQELLRARWQGKYIRDLRRQSESRADEFRALSTDDLNAKIRGYVGEGEFTNDSLETFGGAGVVKIPQLQRLLRYICENGFEHHVAANFSTVAGAVHEAATRYFGWDVHWHKA